MAQTERGDYLTAVFDNFGGVEIVRAGASSVYMQGDDMNQLATEIDKLAELTYPSGPFPTFEQALDYLLGQYIIDQ